MVALGKNTVGYLLDRDNLGGISLPLDQASVAPGNSIVQAAVTYRTNLGTYVGIRAGKHSFHFSHYRNKSPYDCDVGKSSGRTAVAGRPSLRAVMALAM